MLSLSIGEGFLAFISNRVKKREKNSLILIKTSNDDSLDACISNIE